MHGVGSVIAARTPGGQNRTTALHGVTGDHRPHRPVPEAGSKAQAGLLAGQAGSAHLGPAIAREKIAGIYHDMAVMRDAHGTLLVPFEVAAAGPALHRLGILGDDAADEAEESLPVRTTPDAIIAPVGDDGVVQDEGCGLGTAIVEIADEGDALPEARDIRLINDHVDGVMVGGNP